MANLIQIKRSLTTATPGALANGEFAYTANGDVLYIGSNGGVVAIGGERVPGVLTANQALVANATSGIDKIIVANLVPTGIFANGAAGTGGQVLASNSTGGLYWSTPTAGVAGADTQVQFNDGGALAGDAGLTYNKTTDTLTIAGSVLAGATVNAAALTVGSAVEANSTGVYTTGTVNGDIVSVGTSFVANTTRVSLGTSTGLAANGSIGTSGQILTSNGTTVYWADPSAADITSVTAGAGLTGGGTSGGVTLDVGAGNGITVATDAISVDGANGISVDSSGVNVLGGSTLTVNTTGVHVNSDLSITSLTLSGDLVVAGNVTTTNVDSVKVSDPLIYLAGNNTVSDTLDIGFAGTYNDGTQRWTGLFRDHGTNNYRLFANTTQDLSGVNDVDLNATGYTVATLYAYLNTGALVSNSAAVTITANSTVNVNITANSLTLSTPLAGTSGGTGLASYTSGDILVANTGNTLSKLALGTSGYVLQSNGTAVVYGTLDGGTF